MKSFLLSLVIFNISFLIFSQELTNKSTIFPLNPDNPDDVYISLDGSWKFDITTFAEGNISSALQNIVLNMIPDFSASLWIYNKYFFETVITEESANNSFLLGYQNDNGIIKEIRIGNNDLNISEYANFIPPINTLMSPGARVKLGTINSTHEILGRYSNEISNSIRYKGYKEVLKESKTINNYQKGKYFVLPETDYMELYVIENNSYKILSNQEYIYYPEDNLLYVEELNNKTLFLKTKPNDTEGDFILLFKSGLFSTFEHLGCYSTDEILIKDESNLELYVNDKRQSNFKIKNGYILFNDKYPFINYDSEIYTQGGSGLNSQTVLDIIYLKEVPEIYVPTDAKEESLNITINNKKYTDFTHNTDTGVITFEREISTFDDILINYRSENSSGSGNLLLSYGSQYKLLENLTLELSHTGNWNFSSDEYSNFYNENPGGLESRIYLNHQSKYIDTEIQSELSISTIDTTGKFLLFDYTTNQFIFPLKNLIINNNYSSVDFVPLIKRVYKDQYLEFTDINTLETDPLGGGYLIKHKYNEKTYDVLVLESKTLTGNEFSSVKLELDEYIEDYSWGTEFIFDIYSNAIDRDLEIIFNNPGLEGGSLSKTVKIQENSGYTTIKLPLSREERSKLATLDSITFKISDGEEILMFIKNINFTGDSLVTHTGTADYFITKRSGNLNIENKSSGNNKNIVISSPISPIDINNYKSLEFTIDNNNLISNSSNFTFELFNGETKSAYLKVPGDALINGENSFIVDLERKEVILNGNKLNNIEWDHVKATESKMFIMTIDNPNIGSLKLSKLTLHDAIINLSNTSKVSFTVRPPVSILFKDVPIIDNLIIFSDNTFDINEEVIYTGSGKVSGSFLGTKSWTSLSYSEKIDDFAYEVIIPYTDSPIKVKDSFYYGLNRVKNNSLLIDTNLFGLNLSLSDYKSTNKGLRENELIIDILPSYPLNIKNKTLLLQNRDTEIEDISKEINKMYIDILPQNNLDLGNIIEDNINFTISNKMFKSDLIISGKYKQLNTTKRVDGNFYEFNTFTSFYLKKLTITPKIESKYSLSNDESTSYYIGDGIEDYLNTFINTNPYKEIKIIDIFFSEENKTFYNNYYTSNSRSMNSKVETEIENKFNTLPIIDIFIPQIITLSIDKDWDRVENQNNTQLIKELKGDFTINSTIQNSLTITETNKIEEELITYNYEWGFYFFKEILSDIFLDITNNFNYTIENITNISEAKLEWPGKNGPILIVPFINKVFDKPYNYKHTEGLYFKVDQWDNYNIRIRHDTILEVQDINETNIFIDIGYDTENRNHFYFDFGLYTTLIF